MTSEKLTSPPMAPLALRVGIVGHRPNRLAQANIPDLSELIGNLLKTIKNEVIQFKSDNQQLYDDSTPVLRAISPLAEGTDRIFAEQALDAGYELCCIMPFTRKEFERDFASERSLEPESLKRFRTIQGKAIRNRRFSRFELDGNRINEAQAYAICGKTVLNQSDLLLVVWDGVYQGKLGGTENTLKEALTLNIPVIWIDACKNHACQLIKSGRNFSFSSKNARMVPSGEEFSIKELVHDLLALTDEEVVKDSATSLRRVGKTNLEVFYARKKPAFMMAVIWKCFRDVFGDNKFPKPVFRLAEFEGAVKKEWPEDKSKAMERMVDKLRPYYAWPDKLAVLYSDRYRSAFIVTFFLAALAVGMALLPIAGGWKSHGKAEVLCILIEIFVILIIIGNYYFGRRNRWHERWIDYRIIAESIRHLRLVAPMGGSRPFPQPPAHLNRYGQPESTWFAWYVRAVERSLGVPSVKLNREHLLSSLSHLVNLVEGQIQYHSINALRCGRIESKLHNKGLLLFVLTIVACTIHLITGLWLYGPLPDWLSPRLMTFFCGFLPALGAALTGISNQGEFKRICKRSDAMKEQLETIKADIDKLEKTIKNAPDTPEEPFSIRTLEIIGKTARLLINEVLDWRVVFLDRPLKASV